jgi:glucose dehydrogenase
MKRIVITASLSLLCSAALAAPATDRDWPSYGGDDARTRHSPLTQINRDNVAGLQLA